MKRLSDNLFNHMRSFLSFRKIHATRTVAARWIDIESVQKSLWLNDDTAAHISPIACFKNVTFLQFEQESERSKIFCERILYESQSTLTHLVIYTKFQIDFVPRLPRVTRLELDSSNQESLNEKLLQKCPNLKMFFATNYDEAGSCPTIDFRCIPRIEEVYLRCNTESLLNNLVNIGDVDHEFEVYVPNDLPADHICILISKNRHLSIQLEDAQNYTWLTVHRDLIEIDHHQISDDILKSWLMNVKKARDVPIKIGDHMDVEETLETGLCLARTGLFTKEQIKQMF